MCGQSLTVRNQPKTRHKFEFGLSLAAYDQGFALAGHGCHHNALVK
uniref:Uncharacterized protein n=1 Tax=Anguilla anguilla TaxID=7936 RepID=A0A0E9RYX3_ANGAN